MLSSKRVCTNSYTKLFSVQENYHILYEAEVLQFLREQPIVAVMNKDTVENGHDMGGEERKPKLSYAGYVRCGGLINETDYQSAMERADAGKVNEVLERHVENMAEFSGVSLDAIRIETGIDPRVLYGILREDVGAEGLKHHHSQMSDQKLFVETLHMLQKDDAACAVENAYPNIFHRTSFH